MLTNVPVFASFSTNDLAKSRKFYQEKLGIETTIPIETVARAEMANGTSFMMYEKPDHQPATFTVMYFEVADVAAEIAELEANGVVFEDYGDGKVVDTGDGDSKIAWFKDPAENILAIITRITT